LIGVLPLVHLNSRQFGSFTISMPYFNYGGPLAQSAEAEQALMTHAAKLTDDLGCSHMEIRETRSRSGWQATQRKVSMILPLPADDDTLDANLGTKLRAQVNKARKHDISVAFGGVELLDSYYRVFSRNMRDLGTPVYSKSVFKDILTTFPDDAFLAVASQNGTPLAVGFLLGHKDKLEIPWASSIRSKNHLGANMLMYSEILKEAIHRKYQYFDFGRSTKEAATHRFKKQWGAIEHDLHWHYWTRGGEKIPELNPDNPKFKLAIRLWQLLPVAVTRIIGPPVARNLP
jgi:FemAB-related protein (PEP-CTERM system-associated)